MKKIVTVLVIIMLALGLYKYGLNYYEITEQLTCETTATSNLEDHLYPPYPHSWDRVGIVVSASKSDQMLGSTIAEYLQESLQDVFPEVEYLGSSGLLRVHDERFDAILNIWVKEGQINGWLFNKEFNFQITVESIETVSERGTDTTHSIKWEGELAGSVEGLLPTRLLQGKLAALVSPDVKDALTLYMASRKNQELVEALSPSMVETSSWFKQLPKGMQSIPPISDIPLLPSEVELVSSFKQSDLFGTTEIIVGQHHLDEQDMLTKLGDRVRRELGLSDPYFEVTGASEYLFEGTQEGKHYLMECSPRNIKLITREKGPLTQLYEDFRDFTLGKKNFSSVLTSAEHFFYERPTGDTRFLMANLRLERLLQEWLQLSPREQILAVESLEKTFRQCSNPVDGAFYEYALGRLYYKIGSNYDQGYLVQAERAFANAIDIGHTELYPYALLGKALVLSCPHYLGRDLQEAQRLFATLKEVDFLATEASLQLQRAKLLNSVRADGDPDAEQEDYFLKSYVAMLLADWDIIEQDLLKTSFSNFRDEVIKKLLYDNLCHQTDRPGIADGEMPELPEGYFSYLHNYLSEKYSGLYVK